MAISTLVIENSGKAILISAKSLEQITYMKYLIVFQGGLGQVSKILNPVSAIFDLGSEVNVIHPAFIEKLGFTVQSTNIGTQKINTTILKIYRMVLVVFLMIDKANRIKFFEKTFLIVYVSPNIVFGMSFFILSDIDINFPKKEL